MDKMFDIRFFEDIVFYSTPNISCDIFIKDVDKNILCIFKNVPLQLYYWINFNNMHLYSELYIEIYQDDKLLYENLFFRDAEIPYIKKEDLSIIINIEKRISYLIDYYSNFGQILTKEEPKTKYILLLDKYILNIPNIINHMFLNDIKTASSDNFINARLLNQNIW